MSRVKEALQALCKSFIIFPNQKRYKIWQNFLVTLAFYTSIVSSFVFVFLEEPQTQVFNILDFIVNSFFCFDIALNFFVAYNHKETFLLVANPKLTALHYLKTWFFFDVLCNIPPMLHAPRLAHAMFLVLQLFWRYGKILTFFNWVEIYTSFSLIKVRIAKLTWIYLLNMHLGGCIIYFMGATYGPESIWMKQAIDENMWKSYMKSIYLFVSLNSVKPLPYVQATPLDMVFIILFKYYFMGFLICAIANGINLVALYESRKKKNLVVYFPYVISIFRMIVMLFIFLSDSSCFNVLF